MAPTKRQRQLDEGEDVEILESASSELRKDSRKRIRRTAPLETIETDYPPDSTQGRTFREEMDELAEKLDVEQSDDEAGLVHATQAIARSKRSLPFENREMDCGIIESITCSNFMCHTRLHVSLGPLINFIIGHNGSGKSAILSGITLALGGKATSTNRGQSLKSFVKYGEETATLAVKIKNQGPLAYKTDVYGDSITVERHFSVTGSSGFKLKNQEGRVISTKRAELDEIVDFYAFQLDNPVNVLTQDMARQFLNSSTPADKYKFFLRGVQLEQLDLDYSLVGDSLDRAEARQEAVNDDCKIHEERARVAYEKMEASKMQDTIRERIGEYSRQFAWAQVQDKEKELDDLKVELRGIDAKLQQANDKARGEDEKLSEADQILENATLAHGETELELVSERDNETAAKEKQKECDRELQDLLSQQRNINSDVTTSKDTVKNLKDTVKDETEKLAKADDGHTSSLLTAVGEAEANVENLQGKHKEEQQKQAGLEEALVNAESRVKDCRSARDQKRSELDSAEATLTRLMESRGDHRKAFHQNLPQLLDAIKRENGFVGAQPVGPVGEYVRLTKPEWSKILEKSFGGSLNAFCVTRKEDQRLLARIMKRYQISYPINIVNDAPMDTTPHEPDAKYDTMLRVLEISNVLVRNALIMQGPIDKTILIGNQDEATEILYPNHARGPRPHNVNACFSFSANGADTGRGVRFAYGAGGAQKVEPASGWPHLPRMRTDDLEQIRLQKEQVGMLKMEYEEIDKRHRELQGESNRCSQAKKKNIQDTNNLKLAISKGKTVVQDRQRDYENSKPVQGKLDSQKAQLKEAQDELAFHERQLEEMNNSRDVKQAEYDTLETSVKKCVTKVQQMEAKVTKMNLKKIKAESDRSSQLLEKNSAHATVKDIQSQKQGHEQRIQNQEDEVKEFIEGASQVSERVPVPANETCENLDNKISRLHQERKRLERQSGGSREELTKAAAEAKATLERAKRQLDELNLLIKTLKQSLLQRHRRWYKFRDHICVRARAEFMMLLANRQFRGRMLIDHKQKLLDLQVEPDSTRRSGDGRQTKTLSGGEKSFSTICMLLALWNAMGSPIRCLDEFDVFMDSVNRDISTKMMIAAARESVGRQFILITPQSMNNVTLGSDVKIIRLQDPERGQTSLNFNRA